MHILLTDILVCPRCGPQFGLILLADRIENRRVIEGRFGCAKCRRTYAVRHGATDFGSAPRDVRGAPAQEEAVRLAALMGIEQHSRYVLLAGPAAAHAPALRALFDDIEVITVGTDDDGPATQQATPGINRIGIAAAALSGAMRDDAAESGAAAAVPPSAAMRDDAEASGAAAAAAPSGAMRDDAAASEAAATGARLPFANLRLAGVALTGALADPLLEEGARVLSPLGRLVAEPVPPDAEARLSAAGLRIVAQDGMTLVAART